MKIDISFACKCGVFLKESVHCPEPNFMAERNKDSYSCADESVECEKCGQTYEVTIMNSFGGADVSVDHGNIGVSFGDPYYDDVDADENYWRQEPSTQLLILNRHLNSAQELMKISVGKSDLFSLNVMVYGHIVAATEGFLSSVFIKTTTGQEGLIRRLVETDPKFSEMSLSMSELFKRRESIKDTVAGYLRELIFHDLKKVKPMYKSVLGHDLGNIGWLFKAVSKRHDCVHRAGYDKEGRPIDFAEDEVEILIHNVRALCQSVIDTVAKLEENRSKPF